MKMVNRLKSIRIRYWIVGIVVLLILFSGIGFFRSSENPPVAEKEVKNEAVVIFTKAEIRPKEETFAVLRRSGRLDRILKTAGEAVEENSVIAVVDETARKSQLETALSEFQLARANLGRISRLYRSGASTRQEYDDASSAFTVRREALKAARQELDDSLIRAPIPGTVALVAYQVGDVIPSGGRVAIVEDRSSFLFRLSIEARWKPAQWDEVVIVLPDDLGEVKGSVQALRPSGGSKVDISLKVEDEVPEQYIGRWINVKLMPTYQVPLTQSKGGSRSTGVGRVSSGLALTADGIVTDEI